MYSTQPMMSTMRVNFSINLKFSNGSQKLGWSNKTKENTYGCIDMIDGDLNF